MKIVLIILGVLWLVSFVWTCIAIHNAPLIDEDELLNEHDYDDM